MSYDDEKLIIYQQLLARSGIASEADKASCGMDGRGSKLLREAVQEYNEALLALKKKYNRE